LGTLPGFTASIAKDINAAGQVVGAVTVPETSSHGFFADATGPLQHLNDLIPAGSGWVLFEADGINERGQIVGYGSFNGNPVSTFLLTPVGADGGPSAVPLPPALWTGLGTLASAGLWRVWRRRRRATAVASLPTTL
jgi:uncharacterized membrane protein